jgi:hypothetical protein
MNKTRRDWSSVYKCYKDKRDSLTAFYSLASAIIFVAVSFYCTVYYIGIKYPSTETLDQRDISDTTPTRAIVSTSSAPAPGSSSSSNPSTRPQKPNKKTKRMSINDDDSDDDDILSGHFSNNPVNQNLITLDRN